VQTFADKTQRIENEYCKWIFADKVYDILTGRVRSIIIFVLVD